MDPGNGRQVSKAQRIRDLAEQRKSIAEIMQIMQEEGRPVSYQHVYNTLTYSRKLKDPNEAYKARKAMVHHRDDGPRSLEERDELRTRREGVRARERELKENNNAADG
jgi:hypothetical protein